MAIQDTSRPEAPSTTGLRSVSRRDVLKGMAVVAGAASIPTILAACTSGATTAPSTAPASDGRGFGCFGVRDLPRVRRARVPGRRVRRTGAGRRPFEAAR